MSTLYIRMPSKAAADHAGHWSGVPCPYAIAGDNGGLQASGVESLAGLASQVGRVQGVVLILAASDVSLVQVQVPPMSAARLRAALPNLVEDQLISDPADCVLAVAGSGSKRTVAVVQKAWLDAISRSLLTAGARSVAAVPAQLCLPLAAEGASAAVTVSEADLDLAIRLAGQDGVGLPILPESTATAPQETLDALLAIVPQGAVQLYLPAVALPAFESALAAHEAGARTTLHEDDWRYWIAGASDARAINLMSGLAANVRPAVNWRAWRLPLALAAAVLIVNLIGLHIDWWRLRSEASALRATATQVFRTAFPKEPVVDPVAQMRQKLAAARRGAGEAAPDDFLALAAGFGEAWRNLPAGRAGSNAIAALDYKDRSLVVRFKPGSTPPMDEARSALSARALTVSQAPAQGGAPAWQVRSAK